MRILIPLIVGPISFAVSFLLGRITMGWLHDKRKSPCRHNWRVLIEKFPTFTQNRWTCDDCGVCKDFPDNVPPVKTDLQMCNMGHLHTVEVAEYEEWDEWPDVIR